ncbi:threonyl-tRNA synthetase [Mesobacillus boroniphilus JCM 21738]|uniref:Threonyl-tRNA synthetase n=1 Tax=Mesobacillus boroniphilus JCM 21738 TaxID=1294265 RepID=W4RQR4_9BACI|nr:threonyl-tRNA synthetase [Mesobacillus boroniphilus JCM 21738]
MLVVGDNEVVEKAVNVRKYGEQKSETIAFDEFLESFRKEAKK